MNGMRSESSIPIECASLKAFDAPPLQSAAVSPTMITESMKFFLLILLAATIAQSAVAQDKKTAAACRAE